MKEDWKTYKLGEICSQIGDGIHGTPKYCDEGSYFFINGNNFEEGRIVIKSDTKKVNEEEFHKHRVNLSERTLLISINGTIGRTAKYKNEPCILGKSACYLNIKEEFDFNYLYFVLSSQKTVGDFVRNATGTTIKNVGLKWIREYAISLPPLPEQKRIAATLSSLDDKIENNRKINKNLEEQAQALFKSWFVDFEPFKEGEFVDSELGLIPKGWKVVSLSDLMDYSGGSQPPASEFVEEYQEGYVRFVQIRDYESDSHITYIPISKRNKLCDEKDIMIARYGASLGRICMGINGAYNVALAKVFPKKECYKEFLRYYLKSDFFYQSINNKGNRAVQAGFNQSDINSFHLAIPSSDDLFAAYEALVSEITDKILLTEKENRKLSQLRDTLLPKLMNGEIEI